jgi:hypothetical protein
LEADEREVDELGVGVEDAFDFVAEEEEDFEDVATNSSEDEELTPGRLATTDLAIEKTGVSAEVIFDGTVCEGGYPEGEKTENAEA